MSLVTYGYGPAAGVTFQLYGYGFAAQLNLPGLCAQVETDSMSTEVTEASMLSSRQSLSMNGSVAAASILTSKDIDILTQSTEVEKCQ